MAFGSAGVLTLAEPPSEREGVVGDGVCASGGGGADQHSCLKPRAGSIAGVLRRRASVSSPQRSPDSIAVRTSRQACKGVSEAGECEAELLGGMIGMGGVSLGESLTPWLGRERDHASWATHLLLDAACSGPVSSSRQARYGHSSTGDAWCQYNY